MISLYYKVYSKVGHAIDSVFERRYPDMTQEARYQLHMMFYSNLLIVCIIIAVLFATVVSGTVFYFFISMLVFGVILKVLMLVGKFQWVRAVSLPGYWLVITLISYHAPSYDRFEVYKLAAFYIVLLFIATLIIRNKSGTILLFTMSLFSVWVNYVVRGQQPENIELPELDDYVAVSGLLILSSMIANSLIRRSTGLLRAAEDDARIMKERAGELKELNIRLRVNERELTALRDYLRSIIDSMPSVLISLDDSGAVVQWSKEAERVFRVPASDVMGHLLTDIFPQLDPQLKMARDAMAHDSVMAGPPTEMAVPSAEAPAVPIWMTTVYPLRTKDVAGAVVRMDDITEVVRMQEMIIQSEKMVSLGGLAAGMAHEINNPLAGILQNTDVIRNRLTEPLVANEKVAAALGLDMSKMTEYMEKRHIFKMLDQVSLSGRRAAKIVQNMLSFSRMNTPMKEPVKLCDVVRQTLTLMETEFNLDQKFDFKKIDISLQCEECPVLMCEASKIQQVILNILRNGVEAMLDARVSGEMTEPPRFRMCITTDAKKEWVTLEIEDNGSGMDETVRKRIFEPFFTTKEVGRGTGLGLSVSYFIIVENHGGKMEVKSEKGHGTTFIISLPALRE